MKEIILFENQYLWEMQEGLNEGILNFMENSLIIDKNLMAEIGLNRLIIIGFIGIYLFIKVYKFLKKKYKVVKQ